MKVKNSKAKTLPIGIFDSGIGGLTVVRAIRKLLPCEDIIYLGDTARVPYGTKSPETVIQLLVRMPSFC
jgi:glutamate racemase